MNEEIFILPKDDLANLQVELKKIQTMIDRQIEIYEVMCAEVQSLKQIFLKNKSILENERKNS